MVQLFFFKSSRKSHTAFIEALFVVFLHLVLLIEAFYLSVFLCRMKSNKRREPWLLASHMKHFCVSLKCDCREYELIILTQYRSIRTKHTQNTKT